MSDAQQRVRDLVEALRPYDTLVPPGGFWIEDSDGGMEYGPEGGGGDWCEDHGEDMVMRLNIYTPGDRKYELRCNDSSGEYDTIPRCSTCGVTLKGWPTDFCLSEELAYYDDNPDWQPGPEDFHVICMALWNLQWSEDDEAVDAWAAIGATALDRLSKERVSV